MQFRLHETSPRMKDYYTHKVFVDLRQYKYWKYKFGSEIPVMLDSQLVMFGISRISTWNPVEDYRFTDLHYLNLYCLAKYYPL